jgi:hypothetical protein
MAPPKTPFLELVVSHLATAFARAILYIGHSLFVFSRFIVRELFDFRGDFTHSQRTYERKKEVRRHFSDRV